MNSNRKRKIGEREFAAFLREKGFTARRSQQFCGSEGDADLVTSLPYHVEVKRVEKLNLRKAVAQAKEDSQGKPWIIAYRWNNGEWLVTMAAEEFCALLAIANEQASAANSCA